MKKFISKSMLMLMLLLIISGCTANQKFTDMIKSDIGKIIVETETDELKPVTYTTLNKEVIADFVKMMNSMPWDKTEKSSSVFKEKFSLYDESNKQIITVMFTGENIAVIDGTHYEIDEVELRKFTNQFYTDKYKLK